MSFPLADWRIGVTRPAQSDDPFVARLRELGAMPILLPAIQIDLVHDEQAIQDTLANISEYDWIVVTSINTIAALAEAIKGRPINWPRVAAVGSETERAIRALGAVDVVRPEAFVATNIPDVMDDVHDMKIWWPHGASADDQFAATLRSRGATVDETIVYTTAGTLTSTAAHLAFANGIDAMTFTSGTTVDATCEALGDDAISLLSHTIVACIGPRTAEAAERRGLHPDIVAEPHTVRGLADSLARYAQLHPLSPQTSLGSA